MKTIALLLALSLPAPSLAASPCHIYEYAEIQGMADIVLQSEIARVDRLYRGEYQRASELINDGKFVAADITITSSDVCKDQYYRLVAAQKKRQSQTAGK